MWTTIEMRAAVLAFAAMCGVARAETVVFDAALTNTTESAWTFSADGVKYSKSDGTHYLSAASGRITSPSYGMCITSVVVIARRTSDTEAARRLSVRPTVSAAADPESLARDITPGTAKTAVSCGWSAEDAVRAIEFLPVGGSSGNIYLYSAEILGVPLVFPPSDVAVSDVGATRFTLTWTSSGNEAATRIDISKIVRHGGQAETVTNLDFAAFSNGGGNSERTSAIVAAYPELAGSTLLYFPTNSTGQIQISKGEEKGVLVHEGFEDYGDMSMVIVSRCYNSKDEAKSMAIAYIDGDTTNDFAEIALDYDFTTASVPLGDVPGGMKLALNTSGNKKYHRVIVDEISFVRGDPRSWAETNAIHSVTVAGGTTRVRLKDIGLEPLSDYLVEMVALDGDGAESNPAPPVEFRTASRDQMMMVTFR